MGRAYPLTFRIALDAPWDLDATETALTILTAAVLALHAPDIDTLCAALPPCSAPENGTLAPGFYAWQPRQDRYHAAPGVDPSRAISAALNSS
ncbi:MAG: hypothetical protein R8G34_15385 [Paracoccaceae bacterium]|nr:hypothetical protein [Paracoccaceae bacterium]